MPLAARKINRSEIALVHVARNQLRLKEESYRDLLARFGAGAVSSKDLNRDQFKAFMEYCAACGFQRRPSVAGAPEINRQPEAKRPHLRKVWALLKKLGRSWKYADGIAWRMHQRAKVVWCTPGQIHNVVIALEYEANKEAKGPQAGTPAPPKGKSHD